MTQPSTPQHDRNEPAVPLVRIEDLHKHFGALEVLKGIDIDVAAGEKVSIIGPSGSARQLCCAV